MKNLLTPLLIVLPQITAGLPSIRINKLIDMNQMNVKKLFLVALLLCMSFCTYAQTEISQGKAPIVGLKTNLPYWGTATFNAGLEFRLAKKWSLDIEAGLNPFDGKNDDGTYDRTLKHLRIQPELRYWFCEANNGHFLGLHVPYYLYNVADVKLIGLENERREGWGAGVGLSYGYQWFLSKHWSMEATVGVGYIYFEYDRYPCTDCGNRETNRHKNYFGPTQAALNLIYLF